jgi:acyl CoA:acetate/3-ketoacid CoA transferase alpha subunit
LSVWRDIIERKITRLCESGVDKRMELSEAIRRFVKPGMSINPVMMQSRPTSALHELCRQFAGKDPGFEFISSSMSGNYLQLAHLGLVRKAIVSFAGEGYPTPGPSPITRWALERGGFEIENWSMLTISQRLLAGALDVPFMPTRSLVGSTMAVENGAAGGRASSRPIGRTWHSSSCGLRMRPAMVSVSHRFRKTCMAHSRPSRV